MNINYGLIVGWLWAAFIVVWIFSAISAKRTVRSAVGRWFGFRLGSFIVLYFLLRFVLPPNFILYRIMDWRVEALGTLLVVLGIAFAVWARFYLGKNWGMPMSHKENPELVTSGPYRYVRHPIYSGIMLAAFGSALVFGVIWAIIFVGSTAYFLASAPVEERNLTQLFPEAYPAYKKRSKMLIPFIL